MRYRPDIDGLRAVAVILVLIYHGGFSLFPSGFVGVDIFFVISGYLITTIIYSSLNNNHFSFVDFYNRRLWRLQPVFFGLIICSMIISLLFFLPDDLNEFSRSARKASFFVTNSFFQHTTTGYAGPNTDLLPLLHTWSLSVEWQCYLILPLFIYSLHRLFNKKNIGLVVFALTLITLALSIYYSRTIPDQTYYQCSSRFFEFLLGSCIVFHSFNQYSINKYLSNALAAIALMTIVYVARLDHILLGYPNVYAFLVCASTGLLIAVGSLQPVPAAIKLLSLRPLVFIGVLSYSLYIWHWVVFSTLRYQGIKETSLVLMMTYAVTFIVAYLSWRYIEKPTRKLNKTKFHYTVIYLLILPVLVTHTASYVIHEYSGFPKRFNSELVTIYQQLAKYSSPKRSLCIGNNKIDIEAQCRIGSKDADSKTGLMIGDSFSNHYWGFMDTIGQEAHISIIAQGTSSCITLPGINLYDWGYFKNSVYQECHDQTQTYYQMIDKNHYDYVILGQVWSNYLSDSVINNVGDKRSIALTKKRLTHAMDDALNRITASGAKPVIIKTTAQMQEHFYECFFKHIKLRQAYDPKQCSFNLVASDSEQWFSALFDKMKIKYPSLIIIDPKMTQCPKGVCAADINGVPVYRDVGHITDYASYQLGTLYLQQFGNPLI